MECKHCGAQIHFEPGAAGDTAYPYVWVDNSGGDVCGWDGGNEPHEPDVPSCPHSHHEFLKESARC
jgi:hypothetical protein